MRLTVGVASVAGLLLVLSQARVTQAQIFVTTGAGSAFTGVADRTATFSSVATGTDLTNYSEGSLFITTPRTAFTGFDPSAGQGGFSGGFFYPTSGVSAFVNIRTTDGIQLSALEFNVGNGFINTNTFIYYQALRNGSVVGSGALTVLSGSVLGVRGVPAFDQLNIGAAISSAEAQSATSTTQNAIAIDNLRVRLASSTAAPEPGSLTLVAMGALPFVGVVARRKKSKAV